MRAVVYARTEIVYYVLGLADDAEMLVRALNDIPPEKVTRINDPRVVYLERFSSSPVHLPDFQKLCRERVQRRADAINRNGP